jgi:hypothetical protein
LRDDNGLRFSLASGEGSSLDGNDLRFSSLTAGGGCKSLSHLFKPHLLQHTGVTSAAN